MQDNAGYVGARDSGHPFRRRPELLVRPLEILNPPVRKAPNPRRHFVDHIVIVRHQ